MANKIPMNILKISNKCVECNEFTVNLIFCQTIENGGKINKQKSKKKQVNVNDSGSSIQVTIATENTPEKAATGQVSTHYYFGSYF